MTWKEFKDRVEKLGVTDKDVITIDNSAAGHEGYDSEDVAIHREDSLVEIY